MAGLGFGEMVLILVILGMVFGSIGLTALNCLVLSDALKRVPSEFRRQKPEMVWLLMIPCFNAVWAFLVYPRVAQSLRAYFASVGRYDVGDCGEGLALTYCILSACFIVPYLNGFTSIAGLVVMIIFLVKVNTLKAQIPTNAEFQMQQAPEPYRPGFPSP